MRRPTLKVRVIVGLFLIILGVIPKELSTIVTDLFFGFVILLWFHIPLHYAMKRFLFIVPFFAVSAGMLVLADGYDGFVKAELYTGRLLFVAMILAIIMYQTSTEALLKVLHQLRVPIIFIELAFFTLRFTDVFKVEIRNMQLSLRSKGFQTGKFFSAKTIRILGHLLGSMLVRSLQRSERIYLGMQSRGYNGQILIVEKENIQKLEWIQGALLVAILISIQLFLRRGF